MFFGIAVLVTFVLWLPDVYILMKGQPGRRSPSCLLCIVRLAPVRARAHQPRHAQPVTR
jgi:hypothetical protein